MKKEEFKTGNIIREFKKVQINIEKNMNKLLSTYDLTSSQAPILGYIYKAEEDKKEIQQKDIEEFFYLKNPTVTGILDRLEKKGFIKRKISKTDKRIKIVTLTDKSKKIQNEVAECTNEFMKKAFKDISKEEINVFANMINKISYNLEKIDDN